MSRQSIFISEPETDFDILMSIYGGLGFALKHDSVSNIKNFVADAKERVEELIKRVENEKDKEDKARRLHP